MSSPDPRVIVGIRLKIRRAQEHLDRLKSEVRAYVEREPYTVPGEFNADRTEYVFKLREIERPPITWGVLVGEFMHNLHSALEHGIYQLTIADQGHALAGTGFPIYNDPAKFSAVDRHGKPSRNSGLYQIRGVRQELQDLIEHIQPYHAPSPPAEPLWLLREFWNQDKHRLPVLANAAIVGESSISVVPPPQTGFRSRLVAGPVRDGAGIGSVLFRQPATRDVIVKGQFSMQIVLEDSGESPEEAIALLDRVFRRIGEVANSLLLRLR